MNENAKAWIVAVRSGNYSFAEIIESEPSGLFVEQ